MVFKTYKPKSNFTILKDSIFLKNSNCTFYQFTKDTLFVYCDSLFSISEVNDLEWQIPGSSLRKRISNIQITEEYQIHGLLAFDQWPCYNPISYQEDSTEFKFDKYETDLILPIYFKK